MKRILVTGGSVFVSKYVAGYYVKKGDEVYVLNRNHRPQVEGAHLIQGDRNDLGDLLRGYHFDVIIDVTAYNSQHINQLLDAVGGFDEYIMISSSAVYPEYTQQPFLEEAPTGENKFWGKYGTDKIEAEKALLKRCDDAYILRPPYLYGPMNNVYREAFAFECAQKERKFYLPKKGEMKLQFFSVNDLCRFIDVILEKRPRTHLFNVGNKEAVSIKDWITLCYKVVGKEPTFAYVEGNYNQRDYFSFYDYAYYLDVSKQYELMPETESLEHGLKVAYEWYQNHASEVKRKTFIEYINQHFAVI